MVWVAGLFCLIKLPSFGRYSFDQILHELTQSMSRSQCSTDLALHL